MHDLLIFLSFVVSSFFLWDPDVGEGLPGKVEVSLDVLADDGLLVGASDVVPLDTVAVEVVQNGHARLTALAIVWLAASATGGKNQEEIQTHVTSILQNALLTLR